MDQFAAYSQSPPPPPPSSSLSILLNVASQLMLIPRDLKYIYTHIQSQNVRSQRVSSYSVYETDLKQPCQGSFSHVLTIKVQFPPHLFLSPFVIFPWQKQNGNRDLSNKHRVWKKISWKRGTQTMVALVGMLAWS